MSTKDVTDAQVCRAVADWWANMDGPVTYELLAARTGECEKVCFRAMERAERRGLLEYGVSLRTAWLTEEGKALIADVKTFERLGQRYREHPEPQAKADECNGCAFYDDPDGCIDAGELSREAFGGDCRERRVIYIRIE